MELIYKAISYISSKTNKYCKGEINISKDAKLKLQVFTSVVKLPKDVESLASTKLVVDAKLILVDVE